MPQRRDPGSAGATPVPTLQDVARAAGVSTATVSRCLNAPDRVIEETRKRVLKAVGDLGYAPNFGARALAARRTDTFAAIIPTMENAIFARGIQAFQEALDASGITLLIASSSYSPDLEERQITTLVARGADALLLIGHDRPPRVYEFLRRRGIPFVIAWVHDAANPNLSIGFDNRAAMRALTERVLALGHRRLAAISAPLAGNDRARERRAGILAAMAAAGLGPETLAVIETPYTVENGAAAFATLMRRRPRPTVVLCGNDVLAAGAILEACRTGLRVPGDVSVTGFDDIEIARILSPALTTVHVPHRAMGQEAARLLMALRDGHPLEDSICLTAEVRLRDSLGPPSDGP